MLDFSKKKIIVVGDIMLDKHVHGEVSRISPEAPVPVLKVKRETFNLGGAANLANNLASLGAKVSLIGVTGNDEAKDIVMEELSSRGIDPIGIIQTAKPTTQKIRGISNQHLFRLDYEDPTKISEYDENEIIDSVRNKISEADAVILSDYDKGVLTEKVVKEVIQIAKDNGKLITAECKPKNLEYYKGVDLFKPNKKEAFEMTLMEDLEEAGKLLSQKLNSKVIITKGSEGFSLFEKDNKITHIPTQAREVFDVGGAGDTVLAVLTLALTDGKSLEEASHLASEAASLVISKRGIKPVMMKDGQLHVEETKND